MKILTLSIKQTFFDKILLGEKKVETREITPVNFAKYAVYEVYADENGTKKLCEFDKLQNWYMYMSDNPDVFYNFALKKYDALKLITGAYNLPKRPYLIVEILDVKDYIEQDTEGNDIMYEHEGKEYLATTVDYHLGKILEVELYNK